MTWFLAKIEKGEGFPEDIYWPDEIDAFIPMSESLFSNKHYLPERNSVQLYWKKVDSASMNPLVWVSDGGTKECAIDLDQFVDVMKNETYRLEHQKPLRAKLPFNYHSLPASIRFFIVKAFTKISLWQKPNRKIFPISNFNAGCEILLRFFNENIEWKSNYKSGTVVLTHDIETEDDFSIIERISKVEEKHGFRSLWNVVPERYRIDKKLLKNLLNHEHEIGLHGIWHNCKEPFLAESEMRYELNKLKYFIEEFNIKGYRSPAWYRTNKLFRVLSEYFSYDLSCLDNDLLCPAGWGGVGFIRPFKKNNLIELPCTLPFEAPIYEGVKPEKLLKYWIPKIDFIKASKGMLLVITHPEKNYLGKKKVMSAYESFLKLLADGKWQSMLPNQIVSQMK